jgi:hypothetical protein
MVEIVFSDSAGGSLKLAQHYGSGEYCGGAVGVIINHSDGSKPTKAEIENAQHEFEKRERIAWEKAVPLGGNINDVFSLNLAWSVGCITDSGVGKERLAVLKRLFSTYPRDIGKAAAEKLHQNAIKSLEAIRNRAQNGETLRIWYSNVPDEMCGFYWLMSLLKGWKLSSVKVVFIKLPEWEIEDETLIQQNSWGEVEPGKWHRYLSLQKAAPPALLQATTLRWAELQQENAALRAVVNGRSQSVPENFYDHFILREIAAESGEFHEANLIGRILGKYQLGISDSWLALRIEEMICAGKLESVTSAPEDGPSYHRILKKTI